MIGCIFGHLTVLKRIRKTSYLCRCDCGGTEEFYKSYLLGSRVTRCKACRTPHHGMIGTRVYNTWRAMLNRCRNRTNKDWEYYGGRGITVCERWAAFPAFYEDMGDPPEGHTLDRVGVDGNYEPGNCKWATYAEQNANRRCSVVVDEDIEYDWCF